MARIIIEPARNLGDIRHLFAEYAASLGIDLGFQSFDDELRQLPGKYAPPRGGLYIATVDGKTAGCAALRPLDNDRCEMKRLYVRNAFRGLGIGRLLAQKVMDEAAAMGYAAMLLDTLERLHEALALYEKMGFTKIGPYCHNPEPDAVYMQKILRPAGAP